MIRQGSGSGPAGSRGFPRSESFQRDDREAEDRDEGDGDAEDDLSGVQVNHFLSKLGTQLQQRVRAKKQRLEEQFKAVKNTPGNVLVSRTRHAQKRQKLAVELQEETNKVGERMDNIIQLQAINEEKHAKMMTSLTRGSEQVRVAIAECVKSQTSLYEKFVTDLKQLDEKHETGTQDMIERCESTLRELKNRLAAEAMKGETDSLMKMKFYS